MRKVFSWVIAGLTLRTLEPLFPFGHGLSYTEFELSGLSVETTDAGVRASLTVRNTGIRAGSEVVQLYVGQPVCSVARPTSRAEGICQGRPRAGRVKPVEFDLPRAVFAFWSDAKNDWVVEPGEFLIEAGVSSRRIILKRHIQSGMEVPLANRFYFNSALWNSVQSSRLLRLTASRGAFSSSGRPAAPRIARRVSSS